MIVTYRDCTIESHHLTARLKRNVHGKGNSSVSLREDGGNVKATNCILHRTVSMNHRYIKHKWTSYHGRGLDAGNSSANSTQGANQNRDDDLHDVTCGCESLLGLG